MRDTRRDLRGPGAGSFARGSALILALWTLFFLGALAVAVGSYVSAGVQLASRLKGNTVAYQLARAGIELAIDQVLTNVTNWNASVESGFQQNPALFQDNRSLPGGSFSVTYTFISTNGGHTVTNYGILRERSKVNLNTASPATLATVFKDKGGLTEGASMSLATNVVSWRTGGRDSAKKKLAGAGSGEYLHQGFQSLYELLLIDGMTPDLFAELEPFLTIFGKNCYGGTAEGVASVDDGAGGRSILGQRAISFVYDRDRRRLVYWHEF